MTHSHKKGFTLLELLIVITILAILTLVVVLFINPVEILKKSRDVQRMSDLDITRSAINLYLQDSTSNTLGGNTYCISTAAPNSIVETGTISSALLANVKTTLAPSSATATTTAPFVLGGTFVYSATSTPDLNNGTGWIKGFSFAGVGSGAPISKLPIDPTNTAGINGSDTVGIDSLYYRYGCRSGNNTFELDATLESLAYGPTSTTDNKAARDGGNSSMRYEVGTDLTIIASTAPVL